ncbi:MAG: tetratricopeptide repeat protein [Chromatiales bacterium]|nr:tetratricopeptide repeat protein [Chromatiales bacterium]
MYDPQTPSFPHFARFDALDEAAPTDFLAALLAGCAQALADGTVPALHRGLALFAKALLLDETRPEPHVGMGLCYANLGDDDRAIRHFDLCLALGFGQGDYAELVYEYDGPDGETWVVDIAEEQVLLWRAGCQVSLGKAELAKRDLERVSRSVDPDIRAQSSVVWATIHLFSGSLDAAQRQLGQALALDPDNPQAHFVRGRIHEQRGRISSAIKAYNRAIKLDAEAAEFQVARARVFLAAGDPGSARSDLHAAENLLSQQLPQPKLIAEIAQIQHAIDNRG